MKYEFTSCHTVWIHEESHLFVIESEITAEIVSGFGIFPSIRINILLRIYLESHNSANLKFGFNAGTTWHRTISSTSITPTMIGIGTEKWLSLVHLCFRNKSEEAASRHLSSHLYFPLPHTLFKVFTAINIGVSSLKFDIFAGEFYIILGGWTRDELEPSSERCVGD